MWYDSSMNIQIRVQVPKPAAAGPSPGTDIEVYTDPELVGRILETIICYEGEKLGLDTKERYPISVTKARAGAMTVEKWKGATPSVPIINVINKSGIGDPNQAILDALQSPAVCEAVKRVVELDKFEVEKRGSTGTAEVDAAAEVAELAFGKTLVEEPYDEAKHGPKRTRNDADEF